MIMLSKCFYIGNHKTEFYRIGIGLKLRWCQLIPWRVEVDLCFVVLRVFIVLV